MDIELTIDAYLAQSNSYKDHLCGDIAKFDDMPKLSCTTQAKVEDGK